uniref:Uncharacterized protein n=1 Tax=Seriola dumerili TaxID=41447 RepID=A0A3B4U6Y6_SERDU
MQAHYPSSCPPPFTFVCPQSARISISPPRFSLFVLLPLFSPLCPFYSHSVHFLIGSRESREELPSGSMPLNDLFKDPFRTCKTRSDRAPKHEAGKNMKGK